MNKFLRIIIGPISNNLIEATLFFMRVSIGILMIFHGLPKIMGGVSVWREIGTYIFPLGIKFLPTMWGFLGACTEFFGGIALALGLCTRIVSAALAFMMLVATVWHLSINSPYKIYSFPLSLIVIFLSFIIIGGGKFSLDYYLYKKGKK